MNLQTTLLGFFLEHSYYADNYLSTEKYKLNN